MAITKLICPIWKKNLQTSVKKKYLKRVAALEFDHFLKYYENADDLNVRNDKRKKHSKILTDRERQERRERPFNSDSGFTRLFINLGTKDGFYKASFFQFILDESNLKKEVLGRIDLRDMNAWVEVDKSAAAKDD